MPMIDVAQQSEDWLKMRVGMCTASRVKDVIKRLKRGNGTGQKGDYAKSRRDYMVELVSERLTGRAADHYVTMWMEEGTENEPLAKAAYEIATGTEVGDGCFFIHPRMRWFGASPDGLIEEDGCIEAKCLKTENHLEIIEKGEIPEEYLAQMLAELACTERRWCDFISFDPRVPKPLQLFVRRMDRDDSIVAALETEIAGFLAEIEEFIEKLKVGPQLIVRPAKINGQLVEVPF